MLLLPRQLADLEVTQLSAVAAGAGEPPRVSERIQLPSIIPSDLPSAPPPPKGPPPPEPPGPLLEPPPWLALVRTVTVSLELDLASAPSQLPPLSRR